MVARGALFVGIIVPLVGAKEGDRERCQGRLGRLRDCDRVSLGWGGGRGGRGLKAGGNSRGNG